MKILIPLLALIGLVATALVVRSALAPAKVHDAIEYYMGWGGYWHPIGLQRRMTQEEVDAFVAEGAVYLIATYDEDSQLTRVIKMLNNEVFFDYVYTYHPNGRLKSATVARGGRFTVLEYDPRGRRLSKSSVAF